MQEDLFNRLTSLARTPQLLVACDYDGTLAEIAADPARTIPNEASLDSLRALAELEGTWAAIVSGRSLKDLAALVPLGRSVMMIGSHGAEWKNPGVPLSPEQRDRLGQVAGILADVARKTKGASFELKPAGAALHVRGATGDSGDAAIAEAVSQCEVLSGVYVRHGSKVVEFAVVETNKGDSVRRVRFATGATSVIFLGDDLTDEDVFKSLDANDVAVKVGPGETAARDRVPGIADVAEILRELAALRARWIRERNLVALDQCAILSDQRTMAVVSPGARISWLCLPRLDSTAIFAELVGDPTAGFFEVAPAGGGEPLRCGYDGDSFVLVTEWSNLRVTDYLDCSAGRAFQKAGRTDLVRLIEGTSAARIRFAPRLEYGRIATQLRARENGLAIEGSNDPIVLRSPGVPWTIVGEGVHHAAEAMVHPSEGPVVLELRYGTASMNALAEEELQRREQSRRFWSGWAGTLRLPAQCPEIVKRSALVLKALCYGPTGAIAAAATTSLPEQLGGIRNWDYRYCWPRDASKTAAALVRLGNTGHALKFLDWMLEVVDHCETPERLHPIYSLSGGHLPPEAELSHLAGFAQSRPVRIGNAAANQVQLDVFGPIVNLVAMLVERGAPIAPDHWRLVRSMVRAVESRWREPDHGIWEMRLERRHHVHSKIMCWHTIDRALVVEEAVCGSRNPEWIALGNSIREEVLVRGWSQTLGAYSGAYDHDYPDAAVLKIGLTGLIDPKDPRWIATVNVVSGQLRCGPTVRRYRIDDGLPGAEGGMHICTGWLVESLVTLGRIDEAASLFKDFSALVKGPGILTEQFEPRHGSAVGNLAQAYSHLALIDAAMALDRAGTSQQRSPA
ncbi:MAG: trehalose-phosphatase [Planctomycetes bacterium]|nr:trehalose-phosphatase [Planctomycetota bacterium]